MRKNTAIIIAAIFLLFGGSVFNKAFGAPELTDLPDTIVIIEDEITSNNFYIRGDLAYPPEIIKNPQNLVQNGNIKFIDLEEIDAKGARWIIEIRPDSNAYGTTDITIRMTDTSGGSTVRDIRFEVLPVNDPPTAENGTLKTNEDENAEGNCLGSDVDGDALIYAAASPNHGNVTIDPANGTFIYTPEPDFYGNDTFIFIVSDEEFSGTAEIEIHVEPVNDAPIANDSTLGIFEDESGRGNLIATDVDGDSLTYTIISHPTHGSVKILEIPPDPGTGEQPENFSYTPAPNFNGRDTFTFKVSDGELSDTGEVTIDVEPVNDCPEAKRGGQTIDRDKPSTGGKLDASDVDGDPLSYHIVYETTKGNLTLLDEDTGEYLYTPDDPSEPDSFRFRVSDGKCDSETVTFELLPVAPKPPDLCKDNRPPNIPSPLFPGDGSVISSRSVTFKASAFSDPDGNNSHENTHWRLKRADRCYLEYEKTMSNITEASPFTEEQLEPGLKYIWQVSYEDSCGRQSSWSEEFSFKVGESQEDNTISIAPGIEESEFEMISFPQWPDTPASKSVFGYEIEGNAYVADFTIATYDPNNPEGYTEYNDTGFNVEPGKAYWFLAREGIDIKLRGVPVSLNHDIEVRLAYNPDSGNGWNMIACPNNANYVWDNVEVVVYSGDDCSEIYSGSMSNADSGDYIYKQRLWCWKNGTYVYYGPEGSSRDNRHEYDSETRIMESYKGYWVKVMQENISLRFPSGEQGNSRTATASMMLHRERKEMPADDFDDSPPAPISSFNARSDGSRSSAEAVDSGGGGCFISVAASDSP